MLHSLSSSQGRHSASLRRSLSVASLVFVYVLCQRGIGLPWVVASAAVASLVFVHGRTPCRCRAVSVSVSAHVAAYGRQTSALLVLWRAGGASSRCLTDSGSYPAPWVLLSGTFPPRARLWYHRGVAGPAGSEP